MKGHAKDLKDGQYRGDSDEYVENDCGALIVPSRYLFSNEPKQFHLR